MPGVKRGLLPPASPLTMVSMLRSIATVVALLVLGVVLPGCSGSSSEAVPPATSAKPLRRGKPVAQDKSGRLPARLREHAAPRSQHLKLTHRHGTLNPVGHHAEKPRPSIHRSRGRHPYHHAHQICANPQICGHVVEAGGAVEQARPSSQPQATGNQAEVGGSEQSAPTQPR